MNDVEKQVNTWMVIPFLSEERGIKDGELIVCVMCIMPNY